MSPAGRLVEALDVLDRAVADRAFPGAVVAAGRAGEAANVAAVGRLTYEADAAEVRADTLYDLASLTKIIATTTVAMTLVDEGRLDLGQRVVDLLPEFRGTGKAGVTVAQLLSHSAGLGGWEPLYRELAGWPAFVERVAALELTYPAGTQTLYSDLGFILLGALLERLTGQTWLGLVGQRVLGPLGLSETGYCPSADRRARAAPTEECAWRSRLLCGEVHDENAAALGGVAPHAGLFGTAGDVARFAGTMLAGGEWHGRQLVSARTLALFGARVAIPGSTRALGWDTPSDSGYSTAGRLLSRRAIGHTGFTGTSLWIDRERGVFVALLSNRVHPTRHNDAIRWVRPALADAVVRDLTEA